MSLPVIYYCFGCNRFNPWAGDVCKICDSSADTEGYISADSVRQALNDLLKDEEDE